MAHSAYDMVRGLGYSIKLIESNFDFKGITIFNEKLKSFQIGA